MLHLSLVKLEGMVAVSYSRPVDASNTCYYHHHLSVTASSRTVAVIGDCCILQNDWSDVDMETDANELLIAS